MILGVILICIVAVTPIAYRHHKRIHILEEKVQQLEQQRNN